MILIFALILYAFMVMVFLIGWRRLSVNNTTNAGDYDTIPERSQSLSVIVCCKNEAAHLPQLIAALQAQSIKHFEVVWVNDHSTDETPTLMEHSRMILKNVTVIHATGIGKKAALYEGIMAANGQVIVTTDADCIPPSRWLETIERFQQAEQPDLVIGPVRMSSGNDIFSRIQEIEFATLVGSGMGAAAVKRPIFCNAANMAFRKEVWLKHQVDLHPEEISGDDVFLLLASKRSGDKISVLSSNEAIVSTVASSSLQKFIGQRRRWASKTSAYKDADIIITGTIVAAINTLILGYAIAAYFNETLLVILLNAVLFKYLVDLIFVSVIAPFFQLRNIVLYSALLSIVYPVYIVGIGAANLLNKKKDW